MEKSIIDILKSMKDFVDDITDEELLKLITGVAIKGDKTKKRNIRLKSM
jgi:hypothetical protein